MDPIIIGLITIATVIIGVLFYLNKNSNKPKEKQEGAQVARNVQQRNLPPNVPRNRVRPNRLRNRNNPGDDDDNAPAAESDEDVGTAGENYFGDEFDEANREELRKKIGTKKLAKLDAKRERREMNEQIMREREERKEQEEKLYQERKRREAEEERQEKEKELEEKRLKEEQERREHEEYLKLKEAFIVEEEGQDQDSANLDEENLLKSFVDYIKKSKIVVLEDLAAEFKLKTQDAINRVNQVQEMGLLTGLMDDRGKFIYVSEEELQKVKKFIEQRGRVHISELAKSSNELINLKSCIEIEVSE